jgi:hypothetical protein
MTVTFFELLVAAGKNQPFNWKASVLLSNAIGLNVKPSDAGVDVRGLFSL